MYTMHVLLIYIKRSTCINVTEQKNLMTGVTCFSDVEGQPEEEGITDQLGKQQTKRELHHSLQTHSRRNFSDAVTHAD